MTNDKQLTDFELLSKYADPRFDSLNLHAFRWRDDAPPPAFIPLSEKLKHQVWQGKDLTAIELPPDAKWYQREGYDMQHCLQYLHNRYAEAAKKMDIVLYSLIDHEGKPYINIELTLRYGYGVKIHVVKPTVTQIRGFRNECPVADQLMPDLVDFLTDYGKEWNLICPHSNFDGKFDAFEHAVRWMELTKPTKPVIIET